MFKHMPPEMKMKLKSKLLEELMGNVDGAEAKKLAPKPAVAVGIEIKKPVAHGHMMNKLAEGSPEEEMGESPMEEHQEMMAGKGDKMHGAMAMAKPDEGDMSDDDLKKLMHEYMG